MTKLTDIESIGDVYSEKLHTAGVKSVEGLLKHGSDRNGRKTISEVSGISEKMILEWVNRADLSRIKGVGTQYADLLEKAGVDTVPELAQRNAENLFKKMVEINDEKNLVRSMPSKLAVGDWIAQAQKLPRVIQY